MPASSPRWPRFAGDRHGSRGVRRGSMMMAESIEPDTKDWTWVLREPCAECGFDAADGRPRRPGRAGPRQRGRLGRRAGQAPTPRAARRRTWSPLEYACHVRDVHRIFGERLALMLEQDEPEVRELGPGRDRGRRAVRRQDPAMVGPSSWPPRRGGGGDIRRARRRPRAGPRRASAATGASSRSTPSAATTCTTWNTTSTTSGTPRPTPRSRPTTATPPTTATAPASCRTGPRKHLDEFAAASAPGQGCWSRQRRRPGRAELEARGLRCAVPT